jgi:hypothetical protein
MSGNKRFLGWCREIFHLPKPPCVTRGYAQTVDPFDDCRFLSQGNRIENEARNIEFFTTAGPSGFNLNIANFSNMGNERICEM